jgi:hypothetical protein
MKFAGGRAITFWGLPLRSTDETVGKGRPTLTAIFEIILTSLALATYLVYAENEIVFSYLPVITFFILGPLSLQKTEWSTAIGLQYYDSLERMTPKVNAWQEKPGNRAIREVRLFLGFGYFLIIVPIWMWLIRPISVLQSWFSGYFLDSIFAIPNNWYRTVFVLDIFFPPETVPGIEDERKTALYRCRAHFWNAFETMRQEQAGRSTIFKITYLSAWFLQWAILFLPGAVLRLGVKSTALIWAPITALILWRSPSRRDISDNVDYILHDDREKIYRRVFVPFHLTVSLALPVGLFVYHLYSIDFLSPDTSVWSAVVLGFVKWSTGFNVVTRKFETIEIWALCSVINAFITVILLHIAKTEARRERRYLLPEPASNLRISSLMLLRNLISLFLIVKPLQYFIALLTS